VIFNSDACLLAVPRCTTVHGSRTFRITVPTVFNMLGRPHDTSVQKAASDNENEDAV